MMMNQRRKKKATMPMPRSTSYEKMSKILLSPSAVTGPLIADLLLLKSGIAKWGLVLGKDPKWTPLEKAITFLNGHLANLPREYRTKGHKQS